MGDIAEIATRVLSTSLILTSALLLFMTYCSTGAPGARHALLTQAVTHIHRVNGGPVTLGQQAKNILTLPWRGLTTWRAWLGQDAVTWARSTERALEAAGDPVTRTSTYRVLASASGRGASGVSALERREALLTAHVLDGADLAGAGSLADLQQAVARHDRRRLWWLTRHPVAAVDQETMRPIYVRGLDAVGRGTSLGLLVGVVVAGSDSVAGMVSAAGTASLVGASCGSIYFCGTLIRLLPDPPRPSGRVHRRLLALARAHPSIAAAVVPVAVVGSLTMAQWLAQLMGRVLA